MQKILYGKGAPSLKNKDLRLSDATCYESHLRYPTDIKRMWECSEWLYALLHKFCKECGKRRHTRRQTARCRTKSKRKGASLTDSTYHNFASVSNGGR